MHAESPIIMPDGGERVTTDPRFDYLEGAKRNVYSQFGEDGLIEALFAEHPPRSRWCFEVGAADGRFFSNTLCLREQGWNAVLIEKDPEQYEKLWRNASGNCQCYKADVTERGLDDILTSACAPIHPDFGVIDVDGPDIAVWEAMHRFEPCFMLVEYGRPHDTSQPGFDAVIHCGASKRYVPMAATYVNILFGMETIL